jgi:hypothetical protein
LWLAPFWKHVLVSVLRWWGTLLLQSDETARPRTKRKQLDDGLGNNETTGKSEWVTQIGNLARLLLASDRNGGTGDKKKRP